MISCIADSGEAATAWVANVNEARANSRNLDEARKIIADLTLRGAEDRRRDAELIRTLERKCETLSDQVREAESLNKELQNDASQSEISLVLVTR